MTWFLNFFEIIIAARQRLASLVAKQKEKKKEDIAGKKGVKGKDVQDKKGKKGKGKDSAENRVNSELEKIALLQARLAKSKHKPKKIVAAKDNQTQASGGGKKKMADDFSTSV